MLMCKIILIKYVIEFILIIMKKSVKNRSVASRLSVIDFEHGERAEGEHAAYSDRYPFTNSGDIRSVRW